MSEDIRQTDDLNSGLSLESIFSGVITHRLILCQNAFVYVVESALYAAHTGYPVDGMAMAARRRERGG